MALSVGEHVFVFFCDTDKSNKVKSGYGYIKKLMKKVWCIFYCWELPLSKSIHASRISVTCISNITSCYRTRSEAMVQPYVTVFDKKSTKMIPVQNEYTSSIIESIFSRRKGHISPFKTFMEKHMKASHDWLSQEQKKVCKVLNI